MTWHKKFFDAARLVATWSKDPNHQVGCIIVSSDHIQLSGGYNGFPRRVADDLVRLRDRETKLRITMHAEANAVAAAARVGSSLKNATAYITLPPCAQCAALLIQAGIVCIMHLSGNKPSKWEADRQLAKSILEEAGVNVREFVSPSAS